MREGEREEKRYNREGDIMDLVVPSSVLNIVLCY